VVNIPETIKSCEKSPLPSRNENSAARLSSGSLAGFLARKDLADFLLKAFARFSCRRFRVFCE
jgi:hypothetical protein